MALDVYREIPSVLISTALGLRPRAVLISTSGIFPVYRLKPCVNLYVPNHPHLSKANTFSVWVCFVAITLLFQTLSPTVTETTTSSVSLNMSWTLRTSTTAYTIFYSNNNPECFNDSNSLTTSETMYTLTGLEEGTEYSITITANVTGGGGGITEDTITATTMAAGESYISLISCDLPSCIQLHLPLPLL